MKYSEYFTDNKAKLGHLAYVSKGDIFDGKLLYNFLYESKFYEYSMLRDRKRVIGGTSATAMLFDIYNNQDNDAREKHAIKSPHYFQVLTDTFRHLYYRLHWLPAFYGMAQIHHQKITN